MKVLGCLWFIVIQVIALALAIIGVPVVGVLAYFRLWIGMYVYGMHVHSEWRGGRWTWLWGNDEDGVVGPDWYNPLASRWLAFKWSALRNPVNNLRFLVAWRGGPWLQVRHSGYYFQAGFRPDTGWPVLSAGRGTGTVL